LEIATSETKNRTELKTLDPLKKKTKYLKSQKKLLLLYLEFINGKRYLDSFLNAVVNVIPTLVIKSYYFKKVNF